jgi:hypothetical protein
MHIETFDFLREFEFMCKKALNQVPRTFVLMKQKPRIENLVTLSL